MSTIIPAIRHWSIPAGQTSLMRRRILHWAAQFPFAQFLDNGNSTVDRYGSYELLVGIGREHAGIDTWEGAKALQKKTWLMGGLPYELKNRFEPSVHSQHEPGIPTPEVAFFKPETIIILRPKAEALEIIGPDNGLLDALSSPAPLPESPKNEHAQSTPDCLREASRHRTLLQSYSR